MKLLEIAQRLACQLEGEDVEISGIATLSEASAGDLSFLANVKYWADARRTRASAIIVGPDFPRSETPLLRTENPYLAFAKAIDILYPESETPAGIHPTAVLASTADVAAGASVGCYAYIGTGSVLKADVVVGHHCIVGDGVIVEEGTTLHPGCVLRDGVRIGRRCIIHSNAVVGSDGFGFAKDDDGRWHKIRQVGTVVIEDDVEIGAGTTIDRATIGETRIREGTKIDNLVQIGHGCTVGPDALICAQTGLAGSTRVGKQVILAGQVGAAGHLTIGDGVIATPQTGIAADVDPGLTISGSPSFDHRKWLKTSVILSKLPEISKSLRALQMRVTRLEETLENKHEVSAR